MSACLGKSPNPKVSTNRGKEINAAKVSFVDFEKKANKPRIAGIPNERVSLGKIDENLSVISGFSQWLSSKSEGLYSEFNRQILKSPEDRASSSAPRLTILKDG